MKIIFMGTPDFAVSALEALCRAGKDVILAVTQPDRQKGRGRKVIETPVKICAEKWGVPVYQPVRIREAEPIEKIRSLEPDLIVVAAFGQILPRELLEIPRLGCVNIHASLLPRLRGAAPIQWAVINGDHESGITLMQMNEGLDTGDILFQESVPIGPEETGESLYEKLAKLGGEMIVRYLPAIEAGQISPVRQDDEKSSYAPMLRKEMGEIDWSKSAEQISRTLRGMLPWPGAYTTLNGHVLKVFFIDAIDHFLCSLPCIISSFILNESPSNLSVCHPDLPRFSICGIYTPDGILCTHEFPCRLLPYALQHTQHCGISGRSCCSESCHNRLQFQTSVHRLLCSSRSLLYFPLF